MFLENHCFLLGSVGSRLEVDAGHCAGTRGSILSPHFLLSCSTEFVHSHEKCGLAHLAQWPSATCSWLWKKPGKSRHCLWILAKKTPWKFPIRGVVEKMDYYRLSNSTEIFAVVRDLSRPLCNDGNRH